MMNKDEFHCHMAFLNLARFVVKRLSADLVTSCMMSAMVHFVVEQDGDLERLTTVFSQLIDGMPEIVAELKHLDNEP